jgi:hypothetical protein
MGQYMARVPGSYEQAEGDRALSLVIRGMTPEFAGKKGCSNVAR